MQSLKAKKAVNLQSFQLCLLSSQLKFRYLSASSFTNKQIKAFQFYSTLAALNSLK
jgi:hypothetical protein